MTGAASSVTVAVGAIFFIAIGLAVIFGLIFLYHWFRFGGNTTLAFIAGTVYGVGCLAIFSLFAIASRVAL